MKKNPAAAGSHQQSEARLSRRLRSALYLIADHAAYRCTTDGADGAEPLVSTRNRHATDGGTDCRVLLFGGIARRGVGAAGEGSQAITASRLRV